MCILIRGKTHIIIVYYIYVSFSLFIYSSKGIPSGSGSDLRLEQVLPINDELRLLTGNSFRSFAIVFVL